MSEENIVHKIMQSMSNGDDCANNLRFDPHSKTVRPASYGTDPDKELVINPSDLEHFNY